MIRLFVYEIGVFSLVRKSGAESIYAVWIFVILGSACFSLCYVPICGVSWDKGYTSATIFPYFLHCVYSFLMINALIGYLQQLDPINKKDLPDLGTPYMCLIAFLLVEATALLFYAHDVACNLEGDPPSRWWVRTMPYPCIGSIFVIVLHWMKDSSRYLTFYSVAVSVLEVNYLTKIINDLIVPKEGPYKELHNQADANRSEGGEVTAC